MSAWTPKLVFCLDPCADCRLIKYLRRASEGGRRSSDGPPPLAVRLLRVSLTQGGVEEWLRVSGYPRMVDSFLSMLRRARSDELRSSLIYRHRYSSVVRVSHTQWPECLSCPMLHTPRGVMPKTVLLIPEGRLLELVVAERAALESLENSGYIMLRVGNIDEMDYMLSARQEQALMTAYMRGYYQCPRKTRLKDLAREIGVSVSTYAEMLSRAEQKIIEAFVRHELPHYLAYRALSSRRRQLGKPRRRRKNTVLHDHGANP